MKTYLRSFSVFLLLLAATPAFPQLSRGFSQTTAPGMMDIESPLAEKNSSNSPSADDGKDVEEDWKGPNDAVLVRGPYLQSGTAISMVIRWRTDMATNSRVRWGTSPAMLTNMVDSMAEGTEHEVKLTGLQPLSKYYYSIGSTTYLLQGDMANYFFTLPPSGSTGLVRIGVLGDCGNNSTNQIMVRNQLKNYLGNNYMTSWILLGDNAYYSGTDAEYQVDFFNMYKDNFLKQNPLYPCPGNHDYANDVTIQNNHNMPYYSVFSMPVKGEAGGAPSNNKAYYSFNIGNIHFLSLDSYGKEDNATSLYDTLGKQVQWIKADLAANTNKGWIVAYWHHPPYTKGSHDSDTEDDLVQIRTNFIKILERMGVDLLLCGHSHVYERSKLISGHYGAAATFNPLVQNLSSSTGMYNGTANSCPYIKDSVTRLKGTVYVVSGSAGQLGGMQTGFPHNAMYYSDAEHGGAMVLEVEGNRLDAKWICADGVIRDHFTMMKDVKQNRDTTIMGGAITLKASYVGSYNWQPGNQSTRSITVTPPVGTTTYVVKDSFNCIVDSFKVTSITTILPIKWGSIGAWYEKSNKVVQVQWQTLSENGNKYFEVERSANGILYSYAGRITATGTSNMPVTYRFADPNINTDTVTYYYYRIKQVDTNGNFHYSPVVTVKLNSSITDVDIQVLPNPGRSSEMKIRLLNVSALSATLKLTDASGRVIANRHIMLNASLQSFMPDVQPGIYFLTISNESAIVTKQIVVK